MAARPNPDEYNLPAEWIPVSGELARSRGLMALSETQRLIFYNQDVLYHQNLEILQMLDELRAQNRNVSSPKNSHSQASAASEEAESEQKPIIKMPPPLVRLWLPPVLNAEPPTSSIIPTTAGPGFCSSAHLTSSNGTDTTSGPQPSASTLANSTSSSGFVPKPQTSLDPIEFPPISTTPSRINGLGNARNEQGKRKADSSDLEEDLGHGISSVLMREEPFKRQKLEETSKAEDGNTVTGVGFGFTAGDGNSTGGSSDTSTALSLSSTLGLIASTSKLGACTFGTGSSFERGVSTTSGCEGTGFYPFKAYVDKEREGSSTTSQHHQSITNMPKYQKFSFEELRLADYAQGTKFGFMITSMGFGQTKFGAASTPAIEFGYSNTIGFGFNTYKAAGDGSPFSKLATDSSSSKAATSISGVGSAPLPAWNKSVFGSGWSFDSKTNNTPSEVGKFSFARAAAGPQAQSQAPNSGTGSQSEDAPNAAMTNSSTPSAVATTAKDPAGASSLEMPAKEPDTAKGELSSTVSVELHIIEPVEKSESG